MRVEWNGTSLPLKRGGGVQLYVAVEIKSSLSSYLQHCSRRLRTALVYAIGQLNQQERATGCKGWDRGSHQEKESDGRHH